VPSHAAWGGTMPQAPEMQQISPGASCPLRYQGFVTPCVGKDLAPAPWMLPPQMPAEISGLQFL